MHSKSKIFLILACLWLGFSIAKATTFLTLQSTYLGNGWFQYQMSVANDPFFTEADITSLVVNFTNQVDETGGSNNWTITEITNGVSIWSFTNGYPARPYVETFMMRSSQTSYKTATNFNAATVLMSLYLSEFYPYFGPGVISQNIVGYANCPCLVPCAPEEADNSPTNLVYALKVVPDVSLSQILQTNGIVYGVDFLWDYESTFVLQSSVDFNTWTNVAYLWSYPPETLWTNTTPLNSFGNFFRIAIVAGDHTTNLPPLNTLANFAVKPATKTLALDTVPRVTGCKLSGGKLAVNIVTQSGQNVQVQALNSHLAVMQTQQLVANGNSATVYFDAANLPNPVFFNAVIAP